MPVVCAAVVGAKNNPLYLETFSSPAGAVHDDDDEEAGGGALRFHFAVHAALDAVEERVTRSSSSSSSASSSSAAAAAAAQARARAGGVAPDSGEAYLGVLYPSDEFVVYGYASNTRIKLILIASDPQPREEELRAIFKRIHAAFVEASCNPFYTADSAIDSPKFDAAVRAIVSDSKTPLRSMLDAVVAFTRGGEVLWRWKGGSSSSSKHGGGSAAASTNAPLDALVRSCLLEDRASEPSFAWDAPGVGGGAYTLKWSLHNGLGLVVVAIYQRALRLPYVDSLLQSTTEAFAQAYRASGSDGGGDLSSFDATFEKLADAAERSAASGAASTTARAAAATNNNSTKKVGSHASLGAAVAAGEEDEEEEEEEDDGAGGKGGKEAKNGSAINLEAAAAKFRPKGAGGGKKGGGSSGSLAGETGAQKAPAAKKEARVWQGQAPRGAALAALDFSEGKPPVAGAGGAGAGGEDEAFDFTAKSRVDAEEDEEESDEDIGFVFDDEEKKKPAAAPAKAAAAGTTTASTKTSSSSSSSSSSTSALSSFVRSLGLSLAGSAALTADDVQPALDALKKKLMERNVAEPVAEKVCASVQASLVGSQHASFTRVASAVRSAVEEALERILTPRRTVDVLREVRAAKAAGRRPYVITFVGVNGVGKSTSLSKVAYWLSSNGVKVSIAACDTFRAGAVEQLKTHAARLKVPLFERGYEKDPAKVAAEAVRAAARDGVDCVLVDTAGRMQDNEPLMRALAGLISVNDPDLVLFVGEALVGNDGVDQLTQFNARLLDLAPPRNSGGVKSGNGSSSSNGNTNNDNENAAGTTVREGRPCAVDGIVLTKFDTVDDKAGAAVSMVYASGAPVMFVGCGQTYVDLKRLNVRSVVRSLLK